MKPLSPLSKAAITPEESQHVDSWTVPNVEAKNLQDEGKTNALGKSRSWRYEPPEETEVAEPAPLTAEAKGKETIEQQITAMQTLLEQLHQPLANVEKNVEAQLLQLVVQLTQAVTKHEAKTNPDILLSAIAEGVKALPGQESKIQILLNPQDIRLVEEQFGAGHIQAQGWQLLAAPQLSPGGCQIENSTSNIDLSVKSRLSEVLESFLQEALHQ